MWREEQRGVAGAIWKKPSAAAAGDTHTSCCGPARPKTPPCLCRAFQVYIWNRLCVTQRNARETPEKHQRNTRETPEKRRRNAGETAPFRAGQKQKEGKTLCKIFYYNKDRRNIVKVSGCWRPVTASCDGVDLGQSGVDLGQSGVDLGQSGVDLGQSGVGCSSAGRRLKPRHSDRSRKSSRCSATNCPPHNGPTLLHLHTHAQLPQRKTPPRSLATIARHNRCTYLRVRRRYERPHFRRRRSHGVVRADTDLDPVSADLEPRSSQSAGSEKAPDRGSLHGTDKNVQRHRALRQTVTQRCKNESTLKFKFQLKGGNSPSTVDDDVRFDFIVAPERSVSNAPLSFCSFLNFGKRKRKRSREEEERKRRGREEEEERKRRGEEEEEERKRKRKRRGRGAGFRQKFTAGTNVALEMIVDFTPCNERRRGGTLAGRWRDVGVQRFNKHRKSPEP
ncbi:uncharacterized protein V6R79_010651 [Siganus canaliculatus]